MTATPRRLLTREFGELLGETMTRRLCIVRRRDGEDGMTIGLRLGDRDRTLNRGASEKLAGSLGRLATTARKMLPKGDSAARAAVVAELFGPDAARLDPEAYTNDDAWLEGSRLRVGDFDYLVERNPPAVLTLRVPKLGIVGYPLLPFVEAEFHDLVRFRWSRRASEDEPWQPVGDDAEYVPTPNDVGSQLAVTVLPCRTEGSVIGEPAESTPVLIQAPPAHRPWVARQAALQGLVPSTGGPRLRLVSYNLLADACCDTDYARDKMYPYASAAVLDIEYRKHLLLAEIRGFDADIMGLQEVDLKIFREWLLPQLARSGYDGAFLRKGGILNEGEAVFWRADRFRLVSQHDLVLRDYSATASESAVVRAFEACPELRHDVMRRSTVCQTMLLEDAGTGERFWVANTHLYYLSSADHVRLVQAAILVEHLSGLVAERDHAVLFGDWNACPKTPTVEFLSTGRCPEGDARMRLEDRFDNAHQAAEAREILESMTHSLDLTIGTGVPEFTNLVGFPINEFRATLDYVFVTRQTVQSAVVCPMPDTALAESEVALPSSIFPSDHLSVCCDLELRS